MCVCVRVCVSYLQGQCQRGRKKGDEDHKVGDDGDTPKAADELQLGHPRHDAHSDGQGSHEGVKGEGGTDDGQSMTNVLLDLSLQW